MLEVSAFSLLKVKKMLDSHCVDFRVTVVHPTGGEQPYVYKWFTEKGVLFDTLDFVEVLAGTYKVCVTDSASSKSTTCKNIQVKEPLCNTVNLTGSVINYDLTCVRIGSTPPPPPPQSADFRLTITSINPFNPPFEYSWSTGSILNMIEVPAGTYQACLTDSNGETHCKDVTVGNSLCSVKDAGGSPSVNFNVVCAPLSGGSSVNLNSLLLP
jgi:hypothetical protein